MKMSNMPVCSLFLILVLTGCPQAGGNGGGVGPADTVYSLSNYDDTDVFNIYSPEQLRQIETISKTKDFTGKTVKLINDIDLTGVEFSGIGVPASWTESGVEFSGIFDGNGKVVKNMAMTITDGKAGFFIELAGTVKNLGIVSSSVTGATSINVGGIAAENRGTITGCYFSGSVTGYGQIGGLVGYNLGTVIGSYCEGEVKGEMVIGGLVGSNAGTVQSSYNAAAVTSTSTSNPDNTVGGIVGGGDKDARSSVITDCYNIATVTATLGSVGGITGYAPDYKSGGTTATIVDRCYNLGAVLGTSPGGISGETKGNLLYSLFLKDTGINESSNPAGTGDGRVYSCYGWSAAQFNSAAADTYGWMTFGSDFGQWSLKTGLPAVNGVTSRPVLNNVGEGK